MCERRNGVRGSQENERSKNQVRAVLVALDDALSLRLQRYRFAARAWAPLVRCGRTMALVWDWTLVQVTAGISAAFAALTACDGRHTLNGRRF